MGVYGYHMHQTNEYFERVLQLPKGSASYDLWIESYQKRTPR